MRYRTSTYGKVASILLSFFFYFSCFPSLSPAKPNESVQVRNGLLSIDVDNAPLETVLRQIAERANISIVINGPLRQPASLEISEVPIEEGLKRLLSDCNFSFQYAKVTAPDGEERIVLTKAIVFSKEASGGQVRFGTAPDRTVARPMLPPAPARPAVEAAPPPEPPALSRGEQDEDKRVGSGVFVTTDRALVNGLSRNDIARQIGGRTTALRLGLAGGPDLRREGLNLPKMEGVRLTGIREGSIFEKIGLQRGDVVQDINGTRTTSFDSMVEAIHRAVADSNSPLRIEVERGNVIEPIYVEIK